MLKYLSDNGWSVLDDDGGKLLLQNGTALEAESFGEAEVVDAATWYPTLSAVLSHQVGQLELSLGDFKQSHHAEKLAGEAARLRQQLQLVNTEVTTINKRADIDAKIKAAKAAFSNEFVRLVQVLRDEGIYDSEIADSLIEKQILESEIGQQLRGALHEQVSIERQ
jgi:hypothetical protein